MFVCVAKLHTIASQHQVPSLATFNPLISIHVWLSLVNVKRFTHFPFNVEFWSRFIQHHHTFPVNTVWYIMVVYVFCYCRFGALIQTSRIFVLPNLLPALALSHQCILHRMLHILLHIPHSAAFHWVVELCYSIMIQVLNHSRTRTPHLPPT